MSAKIYFQFYSYIIILRFGKDLINKSNNFLSLTEIISSRFRHLFSNRSMDFSADAMAFLVSGIILLKKATESDNWVTFPPLSSKDLVMAISQDLYCSCKSRSSSIFFSNTCFDIRNSSFSCLNEVSQSLVIGFIF